MATSLIYTVRTDKRESIRCCGCGRDAITVYSFYGTTDWKEGDTSCGIFLDYRCARGLLKHSIKVEEQ